MPHSTRSPSMTRVSNSKFPMDSNTHLRTSMEPFPDHVDSSGGQPLYPSSPVRGTVQNGLSPLDRWQTHRDSSLRASPSSWNGQVSTGGREHGRQKSLGDAFRIIRGRRASISQNAHELGDALRAPVSPKLVVLCIIWYFSSALTNTSSKSILNAFPKPATLTLIQFAFVSSFCIFFSWLSSVFPALKAQIPSLRQGVRYPSREIIVTTIPLAAFQIGGHLLSSTATSKIPVSLVHTIKGLSPLFTVFAYRIFFNIRYPAATYFSLIPLTLGVMLACSAEFKGNLFGIVYAFLAAVIFVTQNIFSKRLFNEAAVAEASGLSSTRQLDKLNLLCYSSGLAFLLTSPIWFWSEGVSLLRDFYHDGSLDLEVHPSSFDHGRLALEFVFNGTFHFGQNIIAFVLLSMVSPVTYSVASLIKRVFVVVMAILYFRNPTTKVQGLGIALTFFGLYLYDRTSESKAERRAKLMDTKEESILPLSNVPNGGHRASPVSYSASPSRAYTNGYALTPASDDKKSDEPAGGRGRPRGQSNAAWLPAGTKQEDTWRPRELQTSGLNGLGINVPVS